MREGWSNWIPSWITSKSRLLGSSLADATYKIISICKSLLLSLNIFLKFWVSISNAWLKFLCVSLPSRMYLSMRADFCLFSIRSNPRVSQNVTRPHGQLWGRFQLGSQCLKIFIYLLFQNQYNQSKLMRTFFVDNKTWFTFS